ncbi:hypothetical protein SprV_0401437900 [Sparganum proliferum]
MLQLIELDRNQCQCDCLVTGNRHILRLIEGFRRGILLRGFNLLGKANIQTSYDPSSSDNLHWSKRPTSANMQLSTWKIAVVFTLILGKEVTTKNNKDEVPRAIAGNASAEYDDDRDDYLKAEDMLDGDDTLDFDRHDWRLLIPLDKENFSDCTNHSTEILTSPTTDNVDTAKTYMSTDKEEESTTIDFKTDETNDTTEAAEETTSTEEQSTSNGTTIELKSTTQMEDTSPTTEPNSSNETTSGLESTTEIEDDIFENVQNDTEDHIDLGVEEWWNEVNLDDNSYLQCPVNFGKKNSTRENTTSIVPEVYGVDEVDFDGPEWNKPVKDDDEDFDGVCERTVNTTTPTYLNTTAYETEEEEQATDQVDFNSPEWTKKVDLKDVFSTVCERTTGPTTPTYPTTSGDTAGEFSNTTRASHSYTMVIDDVDEEEEEVERIDFTRKDWRHKVGLNQSVEQVCNETSTTETTEETTTETTTGSSTTTGSTTSTTGSTTSTTSTTKKSSTMKITTKKPKKEEKEKDEKDDKNDNNNENQNNNGGPNGGNCLGGGLGGIIGILGGLGGLGGGGGDGEEENGGAGGGIVIDVKPAENSTEQTTSSIITTFKEEEGESMTTTNESSSTTREEEAETQEASTEGTTREEEAETQEASTEGTTREEEAETQEASTEGTTREEEEEEAETQEASTEVGHTGSETESTTVLGGGGETEGE